MSKIYEALRQAELDRASGAAPMPQSPAYTSAPLDHARSAALLSGTMAPAPWPTSLAAEPIPAQAPFEPELVSATSGFNPAAVRTFPWVPSMHQLPALEERGSSVEQFRSLRSRMYEFRDLNTLKSILVSSGLPQEGKSFVAANLAVSLARHKAGKVLLIDGDMRRSTLHKVFGTTQGPGLTEFLSGAASIAEIMQRPAPSSADRHLPDGLASLSFIPGGDQHDKAADLSGNHRFDALIKTATPHFDWIVVDSSPVNLVSDGVNLARACDAVLLVARGGVTRYETAQRALGELKASKILGFVLNAVEDPAETGGYYGYDGYDKQPE